MAPNRLGQWMESKHQRDAVPLDSQAIRQDRKAAQDLKFNLQPRVFEAPQQTTILSSKASPWIENQPAFRKPEDYPIHQFAEPVGNVRTERAFDDVTILSDIERTRSDIEVEEDFQLGQADVFDHVYTSDRMNRGFNGNRDEQLSDIGFKDRERLEPYNQQQYKPIDEPLEEKLELQESRHDHAYIPAEETTPRKAQGISGRFQPLSSQANHVKRDSTAQHHLNNGRSLKYQYKGASKKHDLVEDTAYTIPPHPTGQELNEWTQKIERGKANTGNRAAINEEEIKFGGSSSEDPEGDFADESPREQLGSRRNHEPRRQHVHDRPSHHQNSIEDDKGSFKFSLNYEVDHDDDELKNIDFSKLKNEPWEAQSRFILPEAQRTPQPAAEKDITNIGLNERIAYFVLNSDSQEQIEFYGSLPYAEWEEAGDIFLAKFGELLNKFKDARKAKRDIVAEFEKEIEEREKQVEGKSLDLSKRLKDMRASGDAVLKGKLGLI